MNPEEKEIISKAATAHKELLEYYRDKDLIHADESTLALKEHSDYIHPRKELIKVANQIALNKKYQIIRDSVQTEIHHLQTSQGGGKTTKWRKKKEAIEKREANIFIYPDIGRPWANTEQEEYRILFTYHINSGMPKEMAQSLTLRDMGLN